MLYRVTNPTGGGEPRHVVQVCHARYDSARRPAMDSSRDACVPRELRTARVPATVRETTAGFGVSKPAISKHLN